MLLAQTDVCVMVIVSQANIIGLVVRNSCMVVPVVLRDGILSDGGMIDEIELSSFKLELETTFGIA